MLILVDRRVDEAIAAGFIERIDHSNIPNAELLLPEFQSLSYDPNHDYSIPYAWGTTGIGFNAAEVSGGVSS